MQGRIVCGMISGTLGVFVGFERLKERLRWEIAAGRVDYSWAGCGMEEGSGDGAGSTTRLFGSLVQVGRIIPPAQPPQSSTGRDVVIPSDIRHEPIANSQFSRFFNFFEDMSSEPYVYSEYSDSRSPEVDTTLALAMPAIVRAAPTSLSREPTPTSSAWEFSIPDDLPLPPFEPTVIPQIPGILDFLLGWSSEPYVLSEDSGSRTRVVATSLTLAMPSNPMPSIIVSLQLSLSEMIEPIVPVEPIVIEVHPRTMLFFVKVWMQSS